MSLTNEKQNKWRHEILHKPNPKETDSSCNDLSLLALMFRLIGVSFKNQSSLVLNSFWWVSLRRFLGEVLHVCNSICPLWGIFDSSSQSSELFSALSWFLSPLPLAYFPATGEIKIKQQCKPPCRQSLTSFLRNLAKLPPQLGFHPLSTSRL